MICQFKGSNVCTHCDRCKQNILFSLVNADNVSMIQFNFASVMNDESLLAESFFISESVKNELTDKHGLSPETVKKSGENMFYLLEEDTDLYDIFLETSSVVFDSKETESISFNSLEKFENYLSTSTGESSHLFLKNSSENQDIKDCTSAKVIKIQIKNTRFKFVMNAAFPEQINILLIQPNSCPNESVSIISNLILSSKSVLIIFFWSILENILFSFLNQIDILGIIFYVYKYKDKVVDSMISKISRFECKKAYSYSCTTCSFESNQSILSMLGVEPERLDTSKGNVHIFIKKEIFEQQISTVFHFFQKNMLFAFECNYSLQIEEVITLVVFAIYLGFFCVYHLVQMFSEANLDYKFLSRIVSFLQVWVSILFFWIYFNNLLILVVQIKMLRLNLFGFTDYMVCHLRAFALVCPHFLSFHKVQVGKDKFERECSWGVFYQLTMSTNCKIQKIRRKIKNNQRLHKNKSNSSDAVVENRRKHLDSFQNNMRRKEIDQKFDRKFKKINKSFYQRISNLDFEKFDDIELYFQNFIKEMTRAHQQKV